MEKKIHNFLNSNLLHKYLVGETSLEESKEVEHFIDIYPEVAQAYVDIQDNLEIHRTQNFLGSLLQHQTLRATKYMSKWIEEKNKED